MRSRSGNLVRCAALLAAIFLLPVGAQAQSPHPTAVVQTDAGPVQGIATTAMDIFLGIPYAAPPVGALRWRAPQPPASWTSPRNAIAFGNTCAQNADLGAGNQDSAAEDCLFLNVFAPTRGTGQPARVPVMVFLHGGGLTTGASSGYVPTKLVRNGVVVVTINYRLGILGFLTHPSLSAESGYHGSGNYGLMDQLFALQWVKRNIEAFGGDPGNVTVFGQSAGGLSVHALLASPLATGLFHKAIVESGAYSLTPPALASAEALGASLASAAGCADQSAACLRALPVAAILTVQKAALTAGALPTVDGYVLTQSLRAAFATGRFNRVPVIEGSTHDEFREFVAVSELTSGRPLTGAAYFPAISATLGVPPSLAALLGTAFYPLDAYPPESTAPSVALAALATDVVFACNAELATWLISSYVPVYQFEFNDPAAPLPIGIAVSFPGGSYHASELQYLFDPLPLGFPGLSADQDRLSDAMARYWTSFARIGDPNGSGGPVWPSYPLSYAVQSLEPPTPVARRTFDADHKCELWTTF